VDKLLCINNLTDNVYQNLALEEFLLKTSKENIFMLWQNEPAVIVGKHQNTLAEINLDFLEQNSIKVARRLSGGGAVYHDSGNLNFTFLINSSEGKMVDFGKYTRDILSILNEMGIPAKSNQRHDLMIEGKKISGNAEHIFKNRVLHHGTILFNSNLDWLEMAIKPQSGRYSDKAVQSIRSKVCNILPYLSKSMDIRQFKQNIMYGMIERYPDSKVHNLNVEEMEEVKLLSDEKYSTWDWIYGYSPKYEVNNRFEILSTYLIINLVVKKGVITNSSLKGNLFENEFIEKINQSLIGLKHHKGIILSYLEQNISFPAMKDFSIPTFVNKLF
jgi:lipoate---protein ligase